VVIVKSPWTQTRAPSYERVSTGLVLPYLSHEAPDAPLPDAVASGAEPFIVIGAIAGG